MRFRELTVDELADKALETMDSPVAYQPVETDGAVRAARLTGPATPASAAAGPAAG